MTLTVSKKVQQARRRRWLYGLALVGTGLFAAATPAGEVTGMLRATGNGGFHVTSLFTVGESIGGYQPPGVLDGTAAFRQSNGAVRVIFNHELDSDEGYPFRLANGLELTGSRLSYLDIDRVTRRIVGAGPVISRMVDRSGHEVTSATQINERGAAGGRRGLEALCSAAGYARGEFGFVDDIVLTHEEVSAREGHPHGGSVWALEVATGMLYALPQIGRGSWENSTALAMPDADRPDGHIALLLGDDVEFGRAPLYLWIGRRRPMGNFVERNGLADGALSVWVADNNVRSPADWAGSGTTQHGRFVQLPVRDATAAGRSGYDVRGYLDDTTLRKQAESLGAFMFSRPEDLHTNPVNPRQAVFASTGHGLISPADDWGDIYLADVEFAPQPRGGWHATAKLALLYDSDETGDAGIRSPDNLVWARDGRIYVQEDKAVKRAIFGGSSGREASIWQLDPAQPRRSLRIAEIDRTAVPAGATDAGRSEIGKWESSGVLDLSELLGQPGETVLLTTVQAHGVEDGPIGGASHLVEAGQLLLLTRPGAGPPR